MRSLKRPMFRKGGNVGTGIMTGVVDRSMHADNPLVRPERTQSSFIEEVQEGVGPYGGMDPLTSYLLAAGPKIAGSTSFSDMISNLEDPNKALTQQAADKAKFDRSIRMEGVKRKLNYDALRDEDLLDYGKKIEGRTYDEGIRDEGRTYAEGIRDEGRTYDEGREKWRLDEENKIYERRLKNERLYGEKVATTEFNREMRLLNRKGEIQKDIAMTKVDPYGVDNLTEVYFEEYKGEPGQKMLAQNHAKYEADNIYQKINAQFDQSQNGGLIGSIHGTTDIEQMKPKFKKNNVNKVFYDVTTGETKRLRLKSDKSGYAWEPVSVTGETMTTISDSGNTLSEISGSEVTLTYDQAQDEAFKRNLHLLPERPEGAPKGWLPTQKRKYPGAITKAELEERIRKEKFQEMYKNIKGKQ